eukprot:NODE_4747_length_746_cov_27.641357_g4586_i0.p1 GENE.NODE_4747_length_746_cov_27.641357_g4586_i0~~NODE_4747_length_746_cov_27.641357_g4586_i0.p1  ORF type:complete len:223 (-),score=95.96 NODE_4747_length_746_cov_27.641357_g4586_i0:53-721(-)
MKSSGFLAEQAGHTGAALDAAVEDLEMRKYLLDRRPKESTTHTAKVVMMQAKQTERHNEAEEKEEEAVCVCGGNDDDLEVLRQQRLQELKQQRRQEQEHLAKGHGEYTEIIEQDFLKTVTGSTWVACHFFHKDFERCKILDKHLYEIAPKLLAVKLISLNAEKAAFFVSKLQVKTLPTIVFFKEGVAVDRMIGFDDIGGVDEFPTSRLVERIHRAVTGTEEE